MVSRSEPTPFDLPKQELKAMEEAFEIFDTEKRGVIDIREIRAALQSLGYEAPNEKIDKMIAGVSEDRRKTISEEEFLALVTDNLTLSTSRG